MRTKLLIPALLLILSACGNSTDMSPLSDYNITPDALPTDTKVKVLEFSGGPDPSKKINCYYQYLIEDTKTGDKYRMLSPFIHMLTKPDGSKTMFYVPMDSAKNGGLFSGLLETVDLDNIDKVVYVDVDEGIAKLPIVIGVLYEKMDNN